MINDSTTAAAKAERVATVACQFCSTLNRVTLDRVSQGPKCGSCGRPILLDRPLHVSDDTFQQVAAAALTFRCSWTSTPTGAARAR